MSVELDKFGKFLMSNLRDNAISKLNTLFEGGSKAPALQELQNSLKSINDEEKEILKKAFTNSLDTGLHDFLFSLHESTENNEGIELIVNGKNVTELSDGLQGELFTEDGWLSKYSAFGEPSE